MLKVFKDFFACKIVFFANHHHPENIQRLFCLQYCLWRKSSLSWKNSKTFSPSKLSQTQVIIFLKIFKDFWLQNCLSRKSSLSWKHSKTFPPAKMSSTQIVFILIIFKSFFACNIVLSANHHYAESIQRLFRLQNCLRRKSPSSWKYSKTFFTCNIVLDANHHYPESIQRIFPLQNCLRRKSSLSWKYAKFFSPAKLS